LLLAAYAAYNRRDSDALLALVSEDVNWPDSSARLHGKAEVRAYWTRQWAVTRTHDEPVRITDLSLDRSIVRISQAVRTLDGTTISEGSFDHVYRIEGGLIVRMDIQDVGQRIGFPSKRRFLSRNSYSIDRTGPTQKPLTVHHKLPLA
jgi:ketosteroid isomerase-like protein